MKHTKLVESILTVPMGPGGRANTAGWVTRHNNALQSPLNEEIGLLAMIIGLAAYADAYQARYESQIGSDYVLGEAWEDGLRAFRALLNGELGRLDGGTLDKAACELYRAAGFEGEL